MMILLASLALMGSLYFGVVILAELVMYAVKPFKHAVTVKSILFAFFTALYYLLIRIT